MNEHQNKSLARTNFGIEILNNLTLQLYSNWLFEKLYLTYERVFHLLFYNLKSSCQTMFFIHSRFLFFWISDKTLLLMCDISLQSIGYQIKHSLSCLMSLLGVLLSGETLILICGISFLDVWISNESLLHVFEYTTTQWCDTRRNTLSHVWYSISQSGYRMKNSLLGVWIQEEVTR